MKIDKAKKIIEENKKSYDAIADDFDTTRQYAWPEFEELAKYVKEGDSVLDIGCGNGRLYKYLNNELRVTNYEYVGVDQSEELIKIAKKNNSGGKFKTADVFNLPFEAKAFDVVAGIAFLHHIPGQELRERVLKEIFRVLKPGGIVFLTNWNLFQIKLIRKYKLSIFDFYFEHAGLDAGDFWIPFQKQNRYYHHFKKKELIGLAKEFGFKVLAFQKGKNSVIILKK
ncbi:MAG: methyltransferase domain-containing protein [Patescibacteria group bacterium]